MQNRKRDTDVQNRLLDPVGEGEGGMFQENNIETCILSRVEGEVGWGIGMGNTCKSMADSFQCMTKPTTIL